jgi:hypothetical protein
MTTAGRNSTRDRALTVEVLIRISQGAPVDLSEPNWLGHTRAAARLDALLVCGAPRSLLDETRGTVAEHFVHLRAVHGIDVVEANGMWRMVVQPINPGTQI